METINACQYWQGYTGKNRPMCNKGNPCVQCRVKFITERGWKRTRNAMWTHPKKRSGQIVSLSEAFAIEDPLANQ